MIFQVGNHKFRLKLLVRKLGKVKSLLSELVGTILRKEKLANAFTSDLIAGEIATILTDLCQQKILKDQIGRLTFEKILDDEIQNVSRDVLEVEKSESEKSTLKNLKLGEMKKRHSSCCQNERLRRRSCDAFRNGIRILNESFSGSWISSQTDFDNLSLEAKCIIVSRELLSRDKMAKMTSADVADLDLKQEDYEIFYRFPQLARDSTPARAKAQKSGQKSDEPAKKKVKKTEKIKTSVKSHSTRVIGSDSLDSIIKHQSPPTVPPSKKVIQLPKKTNSKFSKVPKLSDLKRMRAQVFYDEDIEEAFTHRDSKNQRVDDVIEILSSDDDIIPVQSQPAKPKLKKYDESKNPFFKYYIKEIRDDIIESVLRTELTSALESELLYSDLDPASPDIEISEEIRQEPEEIQIPSVTREQKENLISELSESSFTDIESLVVPEMMKQLATNFIKDEKSRRNHLLKTTDSIMDPVLSEIIREELTFRIISERNRKQTRIRVLFVDQLRSSLIQDFVSAEVRNFLDAEIREKKKTEAIQEEKEILINETLFEVRVAKYNCDFMKLRFREILIVKIAILENCDCENCDFVKF